MKFLKIGSKNVKYSEILTTVFKNLVPHDYFQ